MSYKYAVLWELDDDDSQPAGIVVERDGYVLLELPNEHAMPKRFEAPYRVLGPDMTQVVYEPGAAGYFDQVLVDLMRLYAVVGQDTVESADDDSVLDLLQHHVLAPRTRRMRCDYTTGILAGDLPQPTVLTRAGQVTSYAETGGERPQLDRSRAITVA
jgi:hypothetical protein